MAKVAVVRADAFEGPAVQYCGEDGYPAAYILPVLTAKGRDGKLYQRPNSFKVDYDEEGFQVLKVGFDIAKARYMREVIFDRGWIESDHWVEITDVDLKDYIRQGYGWGGV